MPKIITIIKIEIKIFKILLAKYSAFFLSLLVKCSVKIGIKAAFKAPSPKKLLSKLGIIKAIKKASVSMLAPNLLEIIISLPKPNILQNIVAIVTIPAYLAILCLVSINFPFFVSSIE